MTQRQFSLRALLTTVTACCCLAGLVRVFGFFPLAALFVLVLGCLVLLFPFALVWCCAHHLAPALTKNATVLGAICLALGSLSICSILQSRERTRQRECVRNLQELGFGLHDQTIYHPDESDRQRFDGQAWSRFVQSDFARHSGITSTTP